MSQTFEITLKDMFLDTEIVIGGAPRCVILTPEDHEHRRIGETLADAMLQLSGAKIPLVTSASPRTHHVIALGQMMNNPLIERLYWNRYLFLDSLFPGTGGHVIQSVHNPYPWTSKHNVIVLGGSNSAGVSSAAESFCRQLPAGSNIILPYLNEVVLPEPGSRNTSHTVLGQTYTSIKIPESDLNVEKIQSLSTSKPKENLLAFQEYAAIYLLTGETPYMVAGSSVLMRMCEIYEKDPHRRITWPEETNARYIFAMWDAVEESEVFDHDQRLRITRMLLHFLHGLVPLTSNYEHLEEHRSILWNHTTFPLLGLYFGGRYFDRYYRLSEMKTFLSKADSAFAGQEHSWKPQCDADSYLTLTMNHMIEYGLAEGRATFFDEGHLETYADYLIGISDNEGRASGFGDSSLHRTNSVPTSGVPYAFWYSRNPGYLWYLNSISDGAWPNPYHLDVEPTIPQEATGVQVFPLSSLVYAFTAERPYYNESSGPPNIPIEQSFDKISYRSGMDREDQHFLLDGYGRGKHFHYDTNAILKLTCAGIDWLVDSDYLVRNTTEHNMVSIVADGRVDSPVPECAGLLCLGDTPGFGLTETVVRNYNHVNWFRSIFWKKGDWIVVIDRLEGVRGSSFVFDATWKVLDKGNINLSEDASTLTIVRPARWNNSEATTYTFTLQNASDPATTMRSRTGTAGPVCMVTQRHETRLNVRETYSIQNLLHVTKNRATKLALMKLDETSCLLDGPEPTVLGCGPYEGPGMKISASMYHLSNSCIVLAGVTHFSCGEVMFSAKTPVSLEINVPSNETFLVASERTTVERRGRDHLQIQQGTHRITLNFGEQERRILSEAVKNVVTAGSPIVRRSERLMNKVRPLTEIWSKEPESHPEEITSAIPWSTDTRILDERILICQGRKLKCYDQNGAILWTFTSKGLMRCAVRADIDGDGNEEILCGGDDEHIYVLNDNGHQLAQHLMTERLIIGQGGTENPCVNNLLVESFRGTDDTRIVAGFTNSQISLFDSSFNRIWNRGGIFHGVHKLQSTDLRGDGLQVILAADHYGGVHCISHEGELLGRVYSELGDVDFAVGDIDGDGRLEIINGSGTGTTIAADGNLNTLWQFQTHGYNARQVLCLDLDDDGKSEVLVASDTGYIYALDGLGRVIWQTEVGSPAMAMITLSTGFGESTIAVGTSSGETAVLDVKGRKVGTFPGEAPVKFLLSIASADDDSRLLIVDEQERIRVVS